MDLTKKLEDEKKEKEDILNFEKALFAVKEKEPEQETPVLTDLASALLDNTVLSPDDEKVLSKLPPPDDEFLQSQTDVEQVCTV